MKTQDAPRPRIPAMLATFTITAPLLMRLSSERMLLKTPVKFALITVCHVDDFMSVMGTISGASRAAALTMERRQQSLICSPQ